MLAIKKGISSDIPHLIFFKRKKTLSFLLCRLIACNLLFRSRS
jgi:hypothetical protein